MFRKINKNGNFKEGDFYEKIYQYKRNQKRFFPEEYRKEQEEKHPELVGKRIVEEAFQKVFGK